MKDCGDIKAEDDVIVGVLEDGNVNRGVEELIGIENGRLVLSRCSFNAFLTARPAQSVIDAAVCHEALSDVQRY